jgi:uncharacterized protein
MATATPRKLFLNLPVKDLERSMAFFKALGFGFNPQFTDDKAACMIINEEAYVMLLNESFFKTFTKKDIANTATQTEAICALSCTSRAEVDELVKKALGADGRPAQPPVDHGFMYFHSFYDLDGHHWEVLWMDPAAIQKQ